MKKLLLLFVVALHALSLCAQTKDPLEFTCSIRPVEDKKMQDAANDNFVTMMGFLPNNPNELSIYNAADPITTYKIKVTFDPSSMERVESNYLYSGSIHYPVDGKGDIDWDYVNKIDKMSGKGTWAQDACLIETRGVFTELGRDENATCLIKTSTAIYLIVKFSCGDLIEYRKEYIDYLKSI